MINFIGNYCQVFRVNVKNHVCGNFYALTASTFATLPSYSIKIVCAKKRRHEFELHEIIIKFLTDMIQTMFIFFQKKMLQHTKDYIGIFGVIKIGLLGIINSWLFYFEMLIDL